MKRHPHLQPLSREHHRALLCWRDLDKELDDSDTARIVSATKGLLDYANDRFLSHMADEETLFVGLLNDELQTRLISEHETLRSLLESARRKLSPALLDISELTQLAAMWRAHIRWEERHMFPYLEANTSDDELQAIGDQLVQKSQTSSCTIAPSSIADLENQS